MDKNDSCSWVEKYRPKCLDDIYSQEDVINPLKVGLKKEKYTAFNFFRSFWIW